MNKEEGYIVSGDPNQDFWAQNPELEFHDFGQKAIEEYGREESGFLMWAIYLIEDPDSTLYKANMLLEERRVMIENTYLEKQGIKNPDWEDLKSVIDGYTKSAMPLKKKRFKWLNDAFNDYLLKLSTDELIPMEKRATVFASVDKMYKGLDVAEKAFEKEKLTVRTSGREQNGAAARKRQSRKGRSS